MEMIKIDRRKSSSIREIGYENYVLRIIFTTGNIYEYKNVPGEIFIELKNSGNPGITFSHLVKNVYEFKKVN